MTAKKLRSSEKSIALLYLISTVSAAVSFIITGASITTDNYLPAVFTEKNTVSFGVLCSLVNCFCITAIGIFLYGVIQKTKERIALAVIITRVIEAVVLITGSLSILVLIALSKAHSISNTPSTEYYILGNTLLSWNSRSFDVAMISLAIGGLTLSLHLYNNRLIPRLISITGIIGYLLMLFKCSASLTGYLISDLLFIPTGLFELFFPLWLLFRGFNSKAMVQEFKN